jgi:cytosine/adenosine deaminase-related metal-dependent hydrolase
MIKTNAHIHLDNTGSERLCPKKPVAFLSWLIRAGIEYSKRSDTQCIKGVKKGIEKLLACGTTHIGDISSNWKGVKEVFSSSLKGIVFLEVLGLQKEKALDKLEKAKSEIMRLRDHPNYGSVKVGLSLHSPYACHFMLFAQGAVWCHKEDVPLCIHTAESQLESALLFGKTNAGFPINAVSGFSKRLAAQDESCALSGFIGSARCKTYPCSCCECF